MPNCEQIRKINHELLTQLQAGNQRILALEKQLLEFQRPQHEKSVLSIASDFETLNDPESMDCENANTRNEIASTKSVVPLSPPPPPPPPLPPPNWNLSNANTSNSSKRRKSVPVPSCPLKTLNWIKLNEESLVGTVWTGLDDEELYNILDLKEIDKHFSCASSYVRTFHFALCFFIETVLVFLGPLRDDPESTQRL